MPSRRRPGCSGRCRLPVCLIDTRLSTGNHATNRQRRARHIEAAPSSADAVQRGLQILGIGATEVDPLAGAGVSEAEANSVQPLTFEAQ